MPRGRPKKDKDLPQTGIAQETASETPNVPVVETEAVKETKQEAPVAVPEKPKDAMTYKFICGVCHSSHAGTMTDKGLANRKGSFIVLGRKTEFAEKVELIEILCLKCGCSTWKISPEVEDVQILKANGNLALKRGY